MRALVLRVRINPSGFSNALFRIPTFRKVESGLLSAWNNLEVRGSRAGCCLSPSGIHRLGSIRTVGLLRTNHDVAADHQRSASGIARIARRPEPHAEEPTQGQRIAG